VLPAPLAERSPDAKGRSISYSLLFAELPQQCLIQKRPVRRSGPFRDTYFDTVSFRRPQHVIRAKNQHHRVGAARHLIGDAPEHQSLQPASTASRKSNKIIAVRGRVLGADGNAGEEVADDRQSLSFCVISPSTNAAVKAAAMVVMRGSSYIGWI
jgi:hypothetical protein